MVRPVHIGLAAPLPPAAHVEHGVVRAVEDAFRADHLQREPVYVGVEHRRVVEVDARVVRQLGQRLAGVGFGVAAPQVGDDQRDARIFLAEFPDLPDVVRMGEAFGLGHMQRHPPSARVQRLQLRVGEKVEDARVNIAVPRGSRPADHGVVRLQPQNARQAQSRFGLLRAPLRVGHGQSAPVSGRADARGVGVAARGVVLEARMSETQQRHVALREHRAIAAFQRFDALWRIDLTHPVAALHLLGRRFPEQLRIGHMNMGVHEAFGQPLRQMLFPERAVQVGVSSIRGAVGSASWSFLLQ